LQNTPPAWGDALVQVDIHEWNAAAKTWSAKPIATTDRANFAKGRLWQHNLTLLLQPETVAAVPPPRPGESGISGKLSPAGLAPGRYLLKAYVDSKGKAGGAAGQPLDDSDYAGQTEFDAKWNPGYGAMTVVDGNMLKP
jgi:hypothetical protein